MLAVYPLALYRAWGDPATVAQLYFVVGVCSLLIALSLPLLARRLSRRWIYTAGALLYVLSAVFGMIGGKAVTAALLCHTAGTATVFVCFNAYVLDHVKKIHLGRLESRRLLYSALGWSLGPVLGVWLLQAWHGAPFVIAATAACTLMAVFWRTRIGDGLVIGRANRRPPRPFAYLLTFISQPRLVAGWLFMVIRSCGWWVYIVYVGIFAVRNGLGDQVGGIATSLSNLGLFLAPLMLRWMQRRSVRHAVRTGFLVSACCFLLAALASPLPCGPAGDGRLLPGPAGRLRRSALHVVGQTLAAHRDGGGLFQLSRCVGHRLPRTGLAGAAVHTGGRRLCRSRTRLAGGMGHCRATAS
ncbi:MAG: MFS transporter, partial [Proteobacteria bacterium]|nr:MFS transporter [Pseudomonadota bacterium]